MGRLVGTKGVIVLLRAASLVKARGLDFRLRIIGDGPERARLEAQAQALNLADRIEFLGYQPDAKLGEAMAGVGVIVMPSIAGEVFGLVAVENMMRGIVPIVSGGALAEVVGDASLCFPPGDHEALATCLEKAISSSSYAATQAARVRQRARESFIERDMVMKHLALYRSLTPEPAVLELSTSGNSGQAG